jgi:hypothetical protein
MNSVTTQHVSRSRFLVVGIITAIVAVIANVIAAVLAVQEPALVTPSLTPVPHFTSTPLASSILRYGFDEGTMGWVPQTHIGDQAVIDVQQQIKFGQSSLKLQIELMGKDVQKSKGEVFVNLSSNPPLGTVAPLDLNGKLITMWVYAPSEAIGNPHSPNGVQIFVTDTSDRSQYGVWWNLTSDNTDKWTTVTLRPSPKTSLIEEQRGASTNTGFDPSNINIVGLKIGAASTFDKAFMGSIWIDGVSWP